MIISPLKPAETFRHEAMLYRDTDSFARGAAQYAHDGLALGQHVVVAVPGKHMSWVADALGRAAGQVELLDMRKVGLNPARTLNVWAGMVRDHAGVGGGLRVLSEMAWPGRRPAELAECQLNECLLDAAFNGGAPWSLLCAYDASGLPAATVSGVAQAHRRAWVQTGRTLVPTQSHRYRPAAAREMFSAALPDPPAAAIDVTYRDLSDLGTLLPLVRRFGEAAGLDARRVEGLSVAVTELVTNSVEHTHGGGTLMLWREPDSVVVQVSDTGHITDPLVGRRRPSPAAARGRGIYRTYQACDLVKLRSSPLGTTARIRDWVPDLSAHR